MIVVVYTSRWFTIDYVSTLSTNLFSHVCGP
nr:MAG TPA: Tryptophanase operon leader peptide [Caudoviricetes sp.]